MKTLSMIAQKGGSGKTTLSIHLAVQALQSGLRTLLVDIDPQASVTSWWKRRQAEEPALVQTDGDGLQAILAKANQQGYELTVVDSAPHNTDAAIHCADLSDMVLIPTRPAILDLDAIGATTIEVDSVGTPAEIVLNACPPPTRYGEPQIVSEAREALKVYDIPVCDIAISQRAAFSHALIDGRAVSEFDSKSKAAIEMQMLWKSVTRELNL